MLNKFGVLRALCCVIFLISSHLTLYSAFGGLIYEGSGLAAVGTVARLVRKDERTPVVSTEFGSISAVDIDDGVGGRDFHLQFITLEPNSLFLPVLLHTDMVFYVHTGSGRLSWTDGEDVKQVSLQRGDVYRLKSGTLFYIYSSLEPERPRFRIIAIFTNPDDKTLQEPTVGPYSSINDLVRGFDKKVLQASFQVPEEVIEELTSTTETAAIVHADIQTKKRFWEEEVLFLDAFFGIHRFSKHATTNKKKHTKTFNFFKEDPDFENGHGWSKVVTNHDLHALHGSHIGVYMVNLTKGSMMGPHWNPAATEVSVVLDGEGMVSVVCPSLLTNKECKNARIRVEEGDVFTVPRFHPMAQTSFNNGSLVFMGFSTTSKKNHPQFLAGKASVLQTLDKSVLQASFNVSNTTVDQLLDAQGESIILECISCAEEQEMLLEEELEREKQEEEERKQREEEARRREEERKRREEEEEREREEEQRKREEEEEERRRQEEEERKRQEEEEDEEERKKQEEEERRRHEEERKRREEEAEREREEQKREQEEEEIRRQEEEERRWQEEEYERRRQEEEAKREREEQQRKQDEEERRRQEEMERRQQEEEEERKRQEEEAEREEEQRRREQEEERRRQEDEEQARRREEEEQQRREEEERRQQEEEQKRHGEEEEQRRQEEEEQEEVKRHEEEQRRQEEEGQRREQQREKERQRQAEEQRRAEQEEEQRRQEEEQHQRRREEEEQEEEWEETERREEGRGRQEERGRGEVESEGEIARREEEERVRRQREAQRRWRDIRLNQGKKAHGWLPQEREWRQ